MGFFKSLVAPPEKPVPAEAARQRQVTLEGWTEQDISAVYSGAPVRTLRKGQALLIDLEKTDSFFMLLEGVLQVVVKWNGQMNLPDIYHRGECLAPLPKAAGLLYHAEAFEPTTILEITPTVLANLPERTQLCIYRVAATASSRINAYMRTVNGVVRSKNALLTSYIGSHNELRRAPIDTQRVCDFINNIPALPAHALELAVTLLQENAAVQEVVNTIKQDPSTAGLILRTVNSARFGFDKRIESFYHACMILGFNNIYTLIMHEAVQSSVPVTEETHDIHTHSHTISILCYEIASVAKNVNGQTATTMGILHDVGKGVQVLMKGARWLPDEYIDTFDTARLGARLLRSWNLPDRLCSIIDTQQLAEYCMPDQIAPEFRMDVGVLHLAHVLESILMGTPGSVESTIYTREYMALLGIASPTPEDLLKTLILPSLTRNQQRLPKSLRTLIAAAQSTD